MLNRPVRAALLCVVMAAGLSLAAPAAPAAAQSCDDPETDPTWIALNCPPDTGNNPPPPQPPPGEERRCFHLGIEVDCEDPSRGTWVGDLTGPFCIAPGGSANDYVSRNSILYPDGACGVGSVYQGCYRAAWGPGASLPPPDEVGEDAEGGYYILNCRGMATHGGLQYVINGVWLGATQTIDPREFAFSLLAQLGLSGAEIRMSPPVTGSVLLRMPLWISTTDGYWQEVEDERCHPSGVCVGIRAEAVSIAWQMGDGTVVTCDADQNVAWQRGMDFLNPRGVNACHHYYQRTSRDQPSGRFQVVARTTFRSEWWVVTGGGNQFGEPFENLTSICGPGGNAPCESSAAVLVEELQVLTGR